MQATIYPILEAVQELYEYQCGLDIRQPLQKQKECAYAYLMKACAEHANNNDGVFVVPEE
jgi:hypothetical protein